MHTVFSRLFRQSWLRWFFVLLSIGVAQMGTAQAAPSIEEGIRQNLKQRLPDLPPINEIAPSPMKGLYEVRVNNADIFYTDEKADFLIQGQLLDTQQKRNLTEERIHQLSAIDFSKLPLQDAVVLVRGNGARKIAVFEDPNCGYCKRFEQDLAKLDQITVYVFLYPILSADSSDKSRRIWCAPDRAKAWKDWMQHNKAPAPAKTACDSSAIERNLALGRQWRVNGTPTIVLSNGQRLPGAIEAQELEALLKALPRTAQP